MITLQEAGYKIDIIELSSPGRYFTDCYFRIRKVGISQSTEHLIMFGRNGTEFFTTLHCSGACSFRDDQTTNYHTRHCSLLGRVIDTGNCPCSREVEEVVGALLLLEL